MTFCAFVALSNFFLRESTQNLSKFIFVCSLFSLAQFLLFTLQFLLYAFLTQFCQLGTKQVSCDPHWSEIADQKVTEFS